MGEAFGQLCARHKLRHAHKKCKRPQCELTASLEEIGLLHDAEELFFIHLTITITISFINHLLKFLVGHTLSQFLRHTFEIFEGDFPGLVVVEKTERLQDLILRVPVQDLMCHHLKEFLVLNCATSIVINVGNHLLNLLLFRLKPQSTHRYFELLGINRTGSISIEQIKSLLDFLLLFFSELLLLLASGVEAAKSHCVRRQVSSAGRSYHVHGKPT